jgi:adenine-specific DNA methylase
MIPKECKRLVEVDFPIAVVSKHAAREKSIRHGHPSTLHLWWARRPLAACRAMLLGLLLPDPCDEHCPEDFKQIARELLPKVQGQVGPHDEDLRKSLLKFIGDFANWDFSAHRTYLEVSRSIVKAAHPQETPLVVDPFAGGGSIPLEASRVGCDAFASDLNPVACLILKVLLEDIPSHGTELAAEVQHVGKNIKETVEKELTEFYPLDSDGSKPIAYLWARTVRCESPRCGGEIPLVRSFWLRKKGDRKKALRYRAVRREEQPHQIELEIFEPKTENEVPIRTISNAKATCPFCHMVLAAARVRAQLYEHRGGTDVVFDNDGNRIGGARILAVVTLRSEEPGRHYRLPNVTDYMAVYKAAQALRNIGAAKSIEPGARVPDEPTPQDGTGGVGGGYRTRKYGVHTFGDFFTVRQKLTLITLCSRIAGIHSEPTARLLALSLGKVAMQGNSECRWKASGESLMDAFGRQALPIVWDFAEASPMSNTTGDFAVAIEWAFKVVDYLKFLNGAAQTQIGDACQSPLPDRSVQVWFTDPPYYDSVPYADLSDFFFVWLKRALFSNEFRVDPWDHANPLTPKSREIVRDEQQHLDGRCTKTVEWYQAAMGRAFAQGSRSLSAEGVGCVVFAHKTTEGWEALLTGMIRGGWIITGSWPIATEMGSRLRARESAALATSVHLICRPRTEEKTGDWGEVLRELPKRVRQWIERLQSEHVRGADLVFACIGPALEIYSRYSKVVDAEDREIPLGGDPEAVEPHKRGYLAYVWEAVGRAALEQVLGTAEASARNGAAGALEEDARLTALFLWTLQSTNGQEAEGARREARGEESEEDEDEEEDAPKKKKKGLMLVFDVVRRFAQPLGIHLDNWEDRIIETEKGIVRLLPVGERGAQLFGQDGADLVAERLERVPASTFQLTLFQERTDAGPKVKGKKTKAKKGADKDLRTTQEATTLDRVHAAMLLQASGRTNALRALLQAEQDRSPDFLRLANALSALYPKQSEEKRLLDAMLLAVPR